MNFSSLVLMERDKESNQFIRELGSFEVSDGAEYITKMYYDGEKINVFFDTNKDVLEWEFSAIFDLFNEDIFTNKGYDIEEIDDEYNPTWKVRLDYFEDHKVMGEKISGLCDLIEDEMLKVFDNIKDKKEIYE
jgi:hypothetical protein